jgi:single-stranded-DNA-specific exonuclease
MILADDARRIFELKNKYSPRIVGENHLKLMVAESGVSMDAIGFNFGARFEEVKRAGAFSMAFTLDENEWNGRKSLQLKIKGVEV